MLDAGHRCLRRATMPNGCGWPPGKSCRTGEQPCSSSAREWRWTACGLRGRERARQNISPGSPPKYSCYVFGSIPSVPPPDLASGAQPAGCLELGASIVLWKSKLHSPWGECDIYSGQLARTFLLDVNSHYGPLSLPPSPHIATTLADNESANWKTASSLGSAFIVTALSLGLAFLTRPS